MIAGGRTGSCGSDLALARRERRLRSAVRPIQRLRQRLALTCWRSESLQVNATIHAERLASIIIPIDDEIAHSTSDLLRCASATEWDPRQDRFLRLLWNRLEHLRCYK